MGVYYEDGAVTPLFADLITRLAATWDARPSEARIRTYALRLEGIPPDALRRAFDRVAEESKFFPSVAEIKACLAPTADEAALIAWSALDRAASEVGAWASVVVADRAAAEALRLVFGTWPAYVETDGAAWGTKRAEFQAAYRQAVRAGAGSSPVRLPGLCEGSGAYPTGALRARAIVGLIAADGTVTVGRETGRLEADHGHEPLALREGADTEAGEGPEASSGAIDG